MKGSRVACGVHGLHFDPDEHTGCVVCRREGLIDPASRLGRAPHSTTTTGHSTAAPGANALGDHDLDVTAPGTTALGDHDLDVTAPGANAQAAPTGSALLERYPPPPAWRPDPRRIPLEVRAAPGQRLLARMIDGALQAAILVVACLPAVALGASGGEVSDGALSAAMLCVMAAFLGFTGYQWWLIARDGQTLGKKALGLRIVKQDGSAVGFVDGVVLRNWVIAALGQIVPFIGLVDGLLIFGGERRCLHDHFATTDVVDDSRFAASPRDLADVFR